MNVEIDLLTAGELDQAWGICNLAFGAFLNVPDPTRTFGDRDLLSSRFRSGCCELLAARAEGSLIGSVVATRWGSFGFLGPLTVLPEYWDRGVAQSLLRETIAVFERWRLRQSGLYTFAHSAKHIGLYQKFGYWPQCLTAILIKTPEPGGECQLFSRLPASEREPLLRDAAELTDSIYPGLDLTAEIVSVVDQRLGDAVLVWQDDALAAFAVCHAGPGSEGGSGLCYVKFGAAREATAFQTLLASCEAYAASRGAVVEAGVNMAREDACRRMQARGYRPLTQGVAMLRPHAAGFNRPDVYVLDDWR